MVDLHPYAGVQRIQEQFKVNSGEGKGKIRGILELEEDEEALVNTG